MSEEEKKAIEWLKKADWFSARLYSPTILNLIETQQKEIKELKEGLRKRIRYCNELEKDLFENCSNYVVSKDKIKEIIEELENEQEKNRQDLYNAVQNLMFSKIDKISDKIYVNMSIKDFLKSLLEEE